MTYRIAAIDIHKNVLMVVVAIAAAEVADAAGEALEFICERFGTGAEERQRLVRWLQQQEATEVVMESTAQYWKPIWLELEPHFLKLHLAQAQSNRAPHGRKNDFRDAKRLARRLLAGELSLSYVPEPEQRSWRVMTRSKQQLVRERIRIRNQMEALLEEMQIKLTGVISDLLGASGRRILQALSEGETDPEQLAQLGDERLKCTTEELADALRGHPTPTHISVLKLNWDHVELMDRQIAELDRLVAQALKPHQDTVMRLAEVNGFGVDSAQQLIAEVGVLADAFPSAGEFSSWVGTCPGSNVTAEENHSSRSPKGNKFARRLLTQAAQAAIKKKGSHLQKVFLRFVGRLGYKGAVWVVAHRLSRLVWLILNKQVRYIEKGDETNPKAKQRRAQKLALALRRLGYEVILKPIQPAQA
jgi:transposase